MLIPPAVALIVLGSTGMVEAAIACGDHWHISRTLVGILILAPATSLPNAFTALRLGLANRGAAVVSETLNSNTINLAAGVVAPALAVSLVSLTGDTKFDLAWLMVMTCASLLLLAPRRGMGRTGGAAVIGLYLIFAAAAVAFR